MRYTRILSWILFVVFFLIYLTAIKLVRGSQQPHQRVLHVASAPNQFHHVQFQHQQQPSHQFKETRDLAEFLTFGQSDQAQATSILEPRHFVAPPPQNNGGQFGEQLLARRHQVPTFKQQNIQQNNPRNSQGE